MFIIVFLTKFVSLSQPAAAVIRRVQALSGFIGRKEYVGGNLSQISKPEAQLRYWI